MQPRTKSSSLERESSGKQEKQQKEPHPTQKKPETPARKSSITLGVCAMKKKVQSKPMKEILSRIRCKQIEILEMWQYLDQHWSTWPKVQALICFHSDGFPYLMAWKYVKKHKPFLINNLDKQQLLWDRTVVYDILKRIKVPVAKHYFLFRDNSYLDVIETRGNGKIIPDPQNLDVPDRLQKRIFSNTVEEKAGFNKLKGKARNSLLDMVRTEIQEKAETSKQIRNNLETLKQEEQQQNKDHRRQQMRDSIQVKSKVRYKYSEVNMIEMNKNYPSLLRSYCQMRQIDLYKYEVEEVDDHLVIRCGQQISKLKKPFVQKPFDSENHQICVYYPQSMGGGRKKLFRKVKDCSSEYQNNENAIRKDGNYIYEEFLPTNAFDIKVYTIGPYYMYAEARRSPTLDGVVQRNEQGKEMRFPVILTPDQKFICNRIVQQFEQEVCGFDLLRANNKSYVCDVNGWSFVKSNPKYWQDCAIILKKKIFLNFFPDKILDHLTLDKFAQNFENQYRPPLDNLNPKVEQLRSIVSIFRHGDRSPKLKLKIKTSDQRFIDFFQGVSKDELKFKDAKNLTKCLEIAVQIIAELDNKNHQIKDFLQMKIVLESGGHFQGFTRKLQLKVIDREPMQGGKGPIKRIMIVLKWGGELSYLGYQDAIELGKKMRMERYDDHDCLSLYSSYRHDLKTYSSDEGRCIKTAAAFLKGFLSIQGELAPIISSMVKADGKAQRLLDCTSFQNHSVLADDLQLRLSDIMNSEQDLMTSYLQYCGAERMSEAMKKTIEMIGQPRQKLAKLYYRLKQLVCEIERIYLENWEQEGMHERTSNHELLVDEENCQDIVLVSNRWSKLKKDFYDHDKKSFNISKVPEIYDTIRHDLRKNSLIFNLIDSQIKEDLHILAKTLAYFVVVNEYGITDDERVQVGKDICLPLLEKILVDLMFWKEKTSEDNYWKYRNEAESDNWRHIRTRLYFTSASHMYSLINILTLGNNRILLKKSPNEEAQKVFNILYMGYLSHIEFRLYENLTMQSSDPNRFRLEMSFSTEYKKAKEMKEFSLGGHGFTINEVSEFIQSFVNERPSSSRSKDTVQKRKNSE